MDGFLNVNKEAGWTSHDVVARLRSVLKIQKIGHTGTLDPAATGVLPICLGKATKLARFLTETDKEYRAVMRLGETTDTQDATGKVLSRREAEGLTEGRVRDALVSFHGAIRQIPPMYSAVKVDGQPLYKAARAGREVDRPPRTVVIHRLELLKMEGVDVTMEVACSKGTYVRTLCADIGERLGPGAHLRRLERTRSGPFRIEDALTLPALEADVKAGRIRERILPAHAVLKDFPSMSVTGHGARLLMHGAPIGLKAVGRLPKEFKTGQPVLVYNASGVLIALAEALVGWSENAGTERDRKGDLFKLDKLLVPVEDP
ncbi:MAG TPA: tRNA pseudouridine(55) synthase TruB [Nitrospiria bacterium]|jgi:tRNA pseudouridine55 synthase|nr:tRNA pseudouridine(55) synthase TruB [Nitrospiria bacterium]